MKKIINFTIFFTLMAFFIGTAITVQAADIVKLDINKATAKDFTKLQKIGPKIAEKIISYRKKNGPFKTIEDLMKVKGIGKKIFKLNKNQIMVANTSKENIKKEIKKEIKKDKNKVLKKVSKPKKSK